MSKPVISVVIPTRNRPDTLEVCLRAMRLHTSPAIEIVVQDNCSRQDTVDIVNAAAALDPRIRYSRAPFPTSQRENFEHGLAAATGDYLAIIGDDDGYSMGSLDWLVDRLQHTPVDAVRWNLLHYIWPSLSADGEGFMDYCDPMTGGGCSVESGAEMASKIINTRLNGSWENICVYHGMISRKVYEQMKVKAGGNFFAYPIPDIYAHNIIAFFCDTYLQVNDIVSIYGASGYSAGASWSNGKTTDKKAAAEAERWVTENKVDEVVQKLHWHPEIRTSRYHDFVALRMAEEFGMLGGQSADIKVWTKAIIDEMKMNPVRLPAWLTVEPKTPYDAEIIAAVKAAFPDAERQQQIAVDNRRAFNEKLPSRRVKHIDPALNDDIEGAMKALVVLTGAESARFERAPRTESKVSSLVGFLANQGRRIAPGLSSRIFNSRFFPVGLWRYIKKTQWGTKT
ncbi:MAG: glycosyltransferase family 2 protein [Beijerinckiaceae bacterium]